MAARSSRRRSRRHPKFAAAMESYVRCRQKRQQKAEWRQGQFSQPTIDSVCEELFDASGPGDRLEIVQGRHYGKYVQSGENLNCDKTGEEEYRFQVREDGREYEPWTVTPETDLSGVPLETLEQMDAQMYYCGETDERDAKFSQTRKHIQGEMDGRRSPS